MAKTALVIQDNPFISRLCVGYLAWMGWSVETASTRESALALFSPGRYGVAVCDVNLHDADGIALAEAFRAGEPSLKIIMISGFRRDLERARRSGFPLCLPTPFTPEELYLLARMP